MAFDRTVQTIQGIVGMGKHDRKPKCALCIRWKPRHGKLGEKPGCVEEYCPDPDASQGLKWKRMFPEKPETVRKYLLSLGETVTETERDTGEMAEQRLGICFEQAMEMEGRPKVTIFKCQECRRYVLYQDMDEKNSECPGAGKKGMQLSDARQEVAKRVKARLLSPRDTGLATIRTLEMHLTGSDLATIKGSYAEFLDDGLYQKNDGRQIYKKDGDSKEDGTYIEFLRADGGGGRWVVKQGGMGTRGRLEGCLCSNSGDVLGDWERCGDDGTIQNVDMFQKLDMCQL